MPAIGFRIPATRFTRFVALGFAWGVEQPGFCLVLADEIPNTNPRGYFLCATLNTTLGRQTRKRAIVSLWDDGRFSCRSYL